MKKYSFIIMMANDTLKTSIEQQRYHERKKNSEKYV